MSVESSSISIDVTGGVVARMRPWMMASMLGLLLGATLVFGMVRTTAAGQSTGGNWVRSAASASMQDARLSSRAAVRAVDAGHHEKRNVEAE